MRGVSIDAVLNGYIVKVGCQTLVFQSRGELLVELAAYLENPGEVEKRYLTKYPTPSLRELAGVSPMEAAERDMRAQVENMATAIPTPRTRS
jgi:hypothetical protein